MYEKPKYCSEIPSGGLRLCTETVTFRRVCASCARVGILVLVSSDARSTQPDDEGRTGDRRARRKVVRHLVQGASHSRHFQVPRLDPQPRNIWLADSRGGNSNRRSLSSSCRHRPRFAGSGRKSLPRTVNGTGHTGPKTTLPRSTISTRPWRRSRTRNGSRTRSQRELRTNCEPREPRAAPAKTPPP